MNNKAFGIIEILIIIAIIVFAFSAIKARAGTYMPDGLTLIRCTCYLPTGNRTVDGSIPYEGICASNRQHLGDVAALYALDGSFIGYFECRDTGCAESLQNGTSIDIFCQTEDRAREWIMTHGDYVYIKWIRAEG